MPAVIDIPGFPGYRVQSDGVVLSYWRRVHLPLDKGTRMEIGTTQRILKSHPTRHGYLTVHLCRDGRRFSRAVHRLVLEAFIGPRPPGMECRHLDGNRRNNAATNLCWGTRSQNALDRVRHGTALMGARHHSAKLNPQKVRRIRALYASGNWTQAALAKRFKVRQRTIFAVIHFITWSHVEGGQ